jgi:hypothetical protein
MIKIDLSEIDKAAGKSWFRMDPSARLGDIRRDAIRRRYWEQRHGVRDFNPYHKPKGPEGGQFTSEGRFSDEEHLKAIRGVVGKDFEHDEDIPKFSGLSLGERNTIAEYSDSKAFLGVNAALRSGKPTPEVRDFADKLDSALDRIEDFGATSYRVGSNKPEVLQAYQKAVGKVIREESFMSTARSGSTYLENRRLVNFTIEGKHGKDISRIARERGEREVLFKSGSQFRVKAVKEAPDGKYDVTLEEA